MKPNSYEQILSVLVELKEVFPSYNMGRHLDTALNEYKDIWGMTDKEMLYALTKYKSQLTMDVPHPDESEIDKIVRDGMNLDTILQEDEEDLDN
jgi:hypothetical protein